MDTDKKEHREKDTEGTTGNTRGRTEISAEIEKIGRNADTKLSRVQEKNYDSNGTGTPDEPGRDFYADLKIKNLEGTVSLADIIKEKTVPAKKRTIL